MNGDDKVTLTDLSILKSRSNNVGCTKTSWMIYSSIPQKYIDYNKNHGIYVEQGNAGSTEISKVVDEVIKQNSYDRQRYFGVRGRSLAWLKEEVSEVKTFDRKTFVDETSSSKRNLNDLTANTSNSSTESGYDAVGTNKANNSTNYAMRFMATWVF